MSKTKDYFVYYHRRIRTAVTRVYIPNMCMLNMLAQYIVAALTGHIILDWFIDLLTETEPAKLLFVFIFIKIKNCGKQNIVIVIIVIVIIMLMLNVSNWFSFEQKYSPWLQPIFGLAYFIMKTLLCKWYPCPSIFVHGVNKPHDLNDLN